MPVEDPNDLDRVDREIRINELKAQLPDEATHFVSKDCPPELEEEFLRHVIEYENAPMTTHYAQLTEGGVELPMPEEMDDEQLTAKLWEVIRKLAGMRVFIERTDHLSDRELYSHLWHESLREETPDMPYDEYSAWHIDLLGSGSEEDIRLSLKYYDSEEDRQRWHKEWPEDEIPPHEELPYDRDRLMPKPTYGPPPGDEPEDDLGLDEL